ncbi:hypothetical protein HGB07_06275 [Candidatus Roizmanbacteria bacterium]|nr:hypothetical protein [Candidatus Roizmanbacteria bacterium]
MEGELIEPTPEFVAKIQEEIDAILTPSSQQQDKIDRLDSTKKRYYNLLSPAGKKKMREQH